MTKKKKTKILENKEKRLKKEVNRKENGTENLNL